MIYRSEQRTMKNHHKTLPMNIVKGVLALLLMASMLANNILVTRANHVPAPTTSNPLLQLSTPTISVVPERVSLHSNGTEGNNDSVNSSVSSDGRFVAFESYASNLADTDQTGLKDIFVRDRQSGTTELITMGLNNQPSSDNSMQPVISADGRYVAFVSASTNLTVGDTNAANDVFLYDRLLKTTKRISIASNGTQANGGSETPTFSADTHYVAFISAASNLVTGDTNAVTDIFVYNLQTGIIELVSVTPGNTGGNSYSWAPSLSADGRYVAFMSNASNLTADSDTNGTFDIFVRDRQTGTTERVSISFAGSEANGLSNKPSISADGRYVAFSSWASNLVTDDTNGFWDVFVYDRQTATTQRISLSSTGTQGNGNSNAIRQSMSADGRYVTFGSAANNLVSNDTNGYQDIFLRDLQTGVTERVSLTYNGNEGNSHSLGASISPDGQYITFESAASNLVEADTNQFVDSFLATIHHANGTPLLRVTPLAMNFTVNEDQAAPSAQTLSIEESAGGSLNWSLTENIPWLNTDLSSGSAPSTVQVTVEPEGLEIGTHSGTITISANDIQGSPKVVNVTLVVKDPNPPSPILTVTPTSLTFSAEVGSTNPDPQRITIASGNDTPLTWNLSESIPWLSIDQVSGSSPAVIQVSIDSSGLEPGTYTEVLEITSPTAEGGPQTVTVSLVIEPETEEHSMQLEVVSEANNVWLQWTPLNDPMVRRYQIYRADDSQQFQRVATTIDTMYMDQAGVLPASQRYCYYVEAIDPRRNILGDSNTVCVETSSLMLQRSDGLAGLN